MRILIGNQQQLRTVTRKTEQVIARVAKEAGAYLCLPEKTEVSITLLDNEGIRTLNREYRKIDSPTDVLSFAFDESRKGEEIPAAKDNKTHLLGEIAISLEMAEAQAKEYGHNLEREIGYLTVHGMLHLAGYDHQNEEDTGRMRDLEEKILSAVNLDRDKNDEE